MAVRVLGVARPTRELGGIGIGRGAVVEGKVGRGGRRSRSTRWWTWAVAACWCQVSWKEGVWTCGEVGRRRRACRRRDEVRRDAERGGAGTSGSGPGGMALSSSPPLRQDEVGHCQFICKAILETIWSIHALLFCDSVITRIILCLVQWPGRN